MRTTLAAILSALLVASVVYAQTPVTTGRGPAGPTGAAGANGDAGAQGPAGATGPSGTTSATVQTTDATPTAILTQALDANGRIVIVSGTIAGRKAGNVTGAGYRFACTFMRVADAAVLLGGAEIIAEEAVAAGLWDVTCTTATTNGLVNVTGEAANVDWQIVYSVATVAAAGA